MRTLSDGLVVLNLKDFSQREYCEKSICVRQERRIRKNQSSLLRATANGHEAVVKLLLEKGAELKAKYTHSWTALSWAAEKGHEAVVKLLLEIGAELEAKDKYGWTALSRAAYKGHEAVVKLLLEIGAELETKEKEYGHTPLS